MKYVKMEQAVVSAYGSGCFTDQQNKRNLFSSELDNEVNDEYSLGNLL
jgi:hypothetical protein